MAISARLMLRQGQSLVMTPQLLQAIKLLQLSHLELASFVQDELDRNPLLEREDDHAAPEPEAPAIDRYAERRADGAALESAGDLSRGETPLDPAGLQAAGFDAPGSEFGDAFEAAPPANAAEAALAAGGEDYGLSVNAWSGAPGDGGASRGEVPNLEAYVAARASLPEYLSEQLALAEADPARRLIGQALIAGVDEQGYLRESLEEIAARLGADPAQVEAMLALIQTFEPVGVGARNLAECLAIQLRERDRFDPAMQKLVANLPMLARRDFAALKKICAVDDEDLADMVAEIRRLDPRPGRAFGDEPAQPVAPDVVVRPAADGGWRVELNTEVLPRVLINQTYAAQVSGAGDDAGKAFVAHCLQSANWLTRSLEQRARTILKVASEIVRQQDGFLAHGVEHLRPLNLKAVAEAIGMHESTVSRVTANKYMMTPRGLYEMKYFFSAAIAAESGGEAHSSEAVRHRIRQMIEQEAPNAVLSDDAIVTQLRQANIDIARRTVAKYRESLRIPSSVERRREKAALTAAR